VVADLPATNPLALLIGVATLLAVVALRRWTPRVPGILVAIMAATAAVAIAGWQGQVPVVGEVPSGVPVPVLPHVAPADVLDLLGAGASVALLVFARSMLTVSALARPDRGPVSGRREFLGLAAASRILPRPGSRLSPCC
jgi:SulP family sulfate permease